MMSLMQDVVRIHSNVKCLDYLLHLLLGSLGLNDWFVIVESKFAIFKYLKQILHLKYSLSSYPKKLHRILKTTHIKDLLTSISKLDEQILKFSNNETFPHFLTL